MRMPTRGIFLFLLGPLFPAAVLSLYGQSNSGSVTGTITDPSKAVIPGATVVIQNPVSGLDRTATTDSSGHFEFNNLPHNTYHVTAAATGFSSVATDAEVNSGIPVNLNLALKVAGEATTVNVDSSDLMQKNAIFTTPVDRGLFDKLPLESQSSSLSSLVTLATPGVAADSNGLFHGLGDHASNSFSIDGQPITDQQSKVFSNQIPSNSVQSLEVISGAPPAEYGGKTSLVINVTTRSGQGLTKPVGNITTSYGTFGSAIGSIDLGYGGQNWGNFFELDGLNTGRFLDPPEFAVFYDKGNEQNVFDRVDYNLTKVDSVHVNLNYSRSWFQTPNAYDNLNISNVVSGGSTPNPVFGNVGTTDQRSKIGTFNIAPTYTRIVGNNAIFNFGGYVRRDGYNYYPSGNPLADLGPPNLQTSSIAQFRTLTNAGLRSDFSYQKGINNIKVGAVYQQTFLRENDSLGVVDPTYNSPCVDVNGNPQPGFSDPTQCAAAGLVSNDPVVNPAGTYNSVLTPYDLTRGGGLYNYFG